ncbi:MAG TPA: hypothetical protein DCE42_27040 [Myxococcales bacterium]|nr:hypothetical protein [Deltaproteobacteria bacterium]HAA58449.1 hypothetical protein [Myxococcales bacterium]
MKLLCTICCLLCLPSSVFASSLLSVVDAEDKRLMDIAFWRKQSRAQHPLHRARVAKALGRLQRPVFVPLLQALLLDSDRRVRLQAAFAIGQYGWDKRFFGAHRAALAKLLSTRLQTEKDVAVKHALIEAVGKHAFTKAPLWLIPILQSGHAHLRAEAILSIFRAKWERFRKQRGLKKSTPLSPRLLDMFSKLATHKAPLVRRNIAYYFARTGDKRGFSIISTLAKDPSLWVRFFALTALKKLKDKRGAKLALDATHHTDEHIRIVAIQAAAGLGAAHRLPVTLFRDPSYHVRAAMVQAYGRASKVSLAPLFAMMYDPSPSVRAALMSTLAKRLKAQSVPVLQHAMKEPSWVIRVAAVRASKLLPKGREALYQKGLSDKDVRVRSATVMLLGRVKGRFAWEAIKKALSSSLLSERGAAVEALFHRKEPDMMKVAWAAYQASLSKQWGEVRESFVRLFARGKGSTSYLQKMLTDPSSFVAYKAMKALQKRGVKVVQKVNSPALTFTPHRELVFSKNPHIVIHTNKGKMVIECYAKDAQLHVANFVGMVKKRLYDGLLWHRVISNFVIQGGDPDGTGWGAAGFSMRAEINPRRYIRGVLGMPRSQGWNTGGVQIFFTHVPTPHLDGLYTVFGRIVKGFDVLDRIEQGDRILKARVVMGSATKPTQ